MLQLQPSTVLNHSTLPHHHFDGVNDTLMFNTRLFEGTTTQSFVSTLMGNKERQLQFIKDVFAGCDDVSLSIVDHAVDTPFRCMLVSLFIKQLGEFLDAKFKRTSLFLTPIGNNKDSYLLQGMADGRFASTSNRNNFVEDALNKVVGDSSKVVCKRYHHRKEDIKLTSKDYTLHIRPFRPDGGISRGWHTKSGEYPLMTAYELLNHHNADIPCSNEYLGRSDKNGILINIELEPNRKNFTPTN